MKFNITNAVVEIDKEDFEKVSTLKWHLNDRGYAVWRGIKDGKKQTIRMHRLITDAPKGLVVDHLNHNKLDNRKVNLRVVTQSENMRNRNRGKGYWYHKKNNNWVVEILNIHRGCFDTEQEARDFAALVRAGQADRKEKVIKTKCKHGHSLKDAYIYKGLLRCRKCQSARSKEYYRRKKCRQK